MTVDQKAQVRNAREEKPMSSENDEQNSAEVDCPRCEGCGQLANDDERTPWTFWANLPAPSNMAVQVGMIRPEPCGECNGTGRATTQPAGEQHTGTLDLTGDGNAPASPISDEAVELGAAAIWPEWRGDGRANWDTLHDERSRTLWRACSRAALEAAYPAIRQQVAEEIAAAIAVSRSRITPGRPGWDYLGEAIDITKRVGGVA